MNLDLGIAVSNKPVTILRQCTIIVVAFNGDAWLSKCLNSLGSTSRDQDNLLLVDNSGNTVIESLDLSPFEYDLLYTDAPLGFSAANNLALVRATNLQHVVCFLNQDTLSVEDWLTPCLDLLSSESDLAAVTPLTRTYDGSAWDPYFLECACKSPEFARAMEAGNPFESYYSVPVIPAAAMVVRTEVLRQVGPFDPIYGSYYEDYDLCHRIRRAGYRVGVCTGGAINHFSGSATVTLADERRRARWVTRNRVIFHQREQGSRRLNTLLRHMALTFPLGLARSLLGRPGAKPLGSYLAAHWDLLKLAPRLVSAQFDQARWKHYLFKIGWPPAQGGHRPPDAVD